MKRSRRKYGTTSKVVDWRAVGRRIRALRGFDLSQQQFADRLGISQTYVSEMEHGNVEIGVEILLKIAREFGKDIEWILVGEGLPDK